MDTEKTRGDVLKRRFDAVEGSEDVPESQSEADVPRDINKRFFDASRNASSIPRGQESNPPTSATNGGVPRADTIANHVLGDQPAASAQDDRLGFGPYVSAVAAFLIDPSTKVPLTLSIEGLWGSGKSSFMLQLQALRKRGKTKIVSFNAWQYSADEGLWAAIHRRIRCEVE